MISTHKIIKRNYLVLERTVVAIYATCFDIEKLRILITERVFVFAVIIIMNNHDLSEKNYNLHDMVFVIKCVFYRKES
jgi:hypothetical protein